VHATEPRNGLLTRLPTTYFVVLSTVFGLLLVGCISIVRVAALGGSAKDSNAGTSRSAEFGSESGADGEAASPSLATSPSGQQTNAPPVAPPSAKPSPTPPPSMQSPTPTATSTTPSPTKTTTTKPATSPTIFGIVPGGRCQFDQHFWYGMKNGKLYRCTRKAGDTYWRWNGPI